MSATAEQSPKLEAGYEVANALGRLNADRPKLATRCTNVVTVAKAIRLVLHMLDLHMQATGMTPEQVARDVRLGKIEMRISGGEITMVLH